MGDDGITNYGNAQNCVRVCPMSIRLTKAIYEENRETIIHGLFGWLKRQAKLSLMLAQAWCKTTPGLSFPALSSIQPHHDML